MIVSHSEYSSLRDCRRINVVGTSGSGKSTFSKLLADLLNIPHVEMDGLFWKPQWEESADDDFFPRIEEATNQDTWILDGNYTRATPIKWRRVELVVWLDMSFLRTFSRVTCRVFERSFSQQEIWSGTGNRETLRKGLLSRDSVILWMLTSYYRNRKKYLTQMQSPDFEHIRFVHLRKPAHVRHFLEAVSA